MMKDRILAAYPDSEFGTSNSQQIFVADFTERSQNMRGVEVHEVQPSSPKDETDMDCCVIINESELQIDYNVFRDNQFKNEEDNDMQHGECCMFPNKNDEKSWILFIEIKDCKPSRIFRYKQDVKDKLILNVKEFRDKGIIIDNKVYGVASFPRKKTAFNDMIVSDYSEYKIFVKEYGIHFMPTNKVFIENVSTLKFPKL